jgi:hypothetical protein
MVTVGGGNSRMVKRKDMEHGRGLIKTDTSGNTWMISNTGMEYSYGVMDMYITENGNRIRWMAKDIRGGQNMNIGESSRMTCYVERESNKKTEYYTITNTKKARSSAEVKYHEVLQTLSRNY